MASGIAIETHELVKTYGDKPAVDGINLRVPEGGVYGFLGPNGAGKTTTIQILATLLRPDGGSARVLGHDVVSEADAVRSVVSLTGQYSSVDEDLTGRENLQLLGRILGFSRAQARSRCDDLLEAFGLTDAANRQVKRYSGGMRRRLDIAASIVVTPQILFLDEPTTGLDPRSRIQVWDIVRSLTARGTTVLLTTQYLDEADQLAGRIAVIDTGKVIAEGTSSQLKSEVGSGALHVHLHDPADRPRAIDVLTRALGDEVVPGADAADVTGRVDDRTKVPAALATLAADGVELAGFSYGQPTLDEVFLALTGHPAEETAPSDADTEGAMA
ncbi:ATP-binding cassette domain-containing protein [Mumia sp. zg.B53]|uniref:ATP-binding cassette domain-containing protein n=1 Tax=unclassified Mumia TaxID=2621872 RepID=UPI001C6DFDF0|nr:MULTISPECIES: ATP-binding cassette domain-containing protein [unclassified Mumia]MBW9205084.1 ATP-binding cassette domain-containing protein [Mumia sp. zg.B17]MBW9208912.1 ATP-binding cassette domain-containing protein [Mumia sp. zg.B21]MBW9213524.1 ATP-binding cassette domain-containing protein [Mumia sp. zg.B53]